MSTIIAGQFETLNDAEALLPHFLKKGFKREDLHFFSVNPPGQHATFPIGGDEFEDVGTKKAGAGAAAGAVVGGGAGLALGTAVATVAPEIGAGIALGLAGVGAYTGSLVGGLNATTDTGKTSVVARKAGVLLAIHVVDPHSEQTAKELLRRYGVRAVEKAEGQWLDGQWIDFDPIKPPNVLE